MSGKDNKRFVFRNVESLDLIFFRTFAHIGVYVVITDKIHPNCTMVHNHNIG